MTSFGFKMFNPLNWIILKPATVADLIKPDHETIEKECHYDKDCSRKKSSRYKSMKKSRNKKKFTKTKSVRRK